MVEPDMTRPTARQHDDVPDMPRDLMAAILRRHLDHGNPEDGDRVRVGDGITGQTLAEGTWAGTAEDDHHVGSVQTDGGTTFPVPEGSSIRVLVAVPRARPGVLTLDELYVAAELAAELGAVYDGEPLGAVADELARRIWDACGFSDPEEQASGCGTLSRPVHAAIAEPPGHRRGIRSPHALTEVLQGDRLRAE